MAEISQFITMNHFLNRNVPGLHKKKKKKNEGFRVELRAKSDFKSNARGKLRQTIYFFWPYMYFIAPIDYCVE